MICLMPNIDSLWVLRSRRRRKNIQTFFDWNREVRRRKKSFGIPLIVFDSCNAFLRDSSGWKVMKEARLFITVGHDGFWFLFCEIFFPSRRWGSTAGLARFFAPRTFFNQSCGRSPSKKKYKLKWHHLTPTSFRRNKNRLLAVRACRV